MSESNKDSISIKNEVITIDIKPFLMPISIIFSAIILSSGLFFGLNNISNALKGAGLNTTATTQTGTTGTTTTPQAQATVSIDKIKELFKGNNIKFGDENSKLLFVEVADPSCPYCHIAGGLNPELNKSAGNQFILTQDGGTYVAPVPAMKKLVDEGKASFVYIYSNGHGNGEIATQALYCAYEKGKFWEAHDLLMTSKGYSLINDTVKNDTTKSGDMANFLSSAVNSNDMKNCLDSGKYANRISEDQATARSLGVSGTPGFFINETNFAGAYSWTDMKSVAEKALNN